MVSGVPSGSGWSSARTIIFVCISNYAQYVVVICNLGISNLDDSLTMDLFDLPFPVTSNARLEPHPQSPSPNL